MKGEATTILTPGEHKGAGARYLQEARMLLIVARFRCRSRTLMRSRVQAFAKGTGGGGQRDAWGRG